ncbi:serine/arginine repetitive matrix protein 2 [Salinibacterium sp. UTAS2018]|uniref:EcsC family protein n=1 Tax=Salinibacterium sp. UTAS2018 TaxID=2508880 RepID=UPI0010095E08|nr:EcsC family protein [Salinibacterium sp. UTAS2018]QAV69253.1 serine/arginine repetitive matrix protein 2 [Salinibacterium sp. UTAS2018]
MTSPSEYELIAWRHVQDFKGRAISRTARKAGEKVVEGVNAFGKNASSYLESHPKTQSAVARGQNIVGAGISAAGSGFRTVADAIPEGVTDWSGSAFDSIRNTTARVSRAGLSPKRVMARHRKRGHDVSAFADLRRLDLEQIDIVRGRGASWYYPATAALSGMGAGLVISGGEMVTVASAGAAAAPSGAAVVGAFAGDAAIVLGLASRSVGHVSMFYGYDPEEPAEKLFIMSVVNAGSALSATTKTAAMADISRLTQALVRGKSWEVLNASIVSRVSAAFAKQFGFRLTKQGLGKVVPAAGILIGGTLNWSTLEGIVDAADVAYRRRFLLEKYPHLAHDENSDFVVHENEESEDVDDHSISVLDDLADAGGPDLR